MLSISLRAARRLAIVNQHLSGAPKPEMSALVRDLGCLQLDPTSAVTQSHLLVLWSRLGRYDRDELDGLLWTERSLFEYFAHAASIVCTEDYPIHNLMMRRYAKGDSAWAVRAREFMRTNGAMRRHILARLRRDGPLPLGAFEDRSLVAWESTGWTNERTIARTLDFLWAQGKVMVAGRRGRTRLWDLAERCLPEWTPRAALSEREVVRRAVRRAVRALGVARAKDIREHFTRGRYPGLAAVLQELERKGELVRARVEGGDEDWFLHAGDVATVEAVERDFAARTTLLSPFDNLICDRARTERLFGFRFRLEIYTPKDKRVHGFFVMPVLHGDRLIARVDPLFDRKGSRLVLNAVHHEDGVRGRAGRALTGAVEDLAAFLGAADVVT